MGYRGLIGMFTTQGAKGLALMKTYGALTGLTQDIMKDYQANLAPGYQKAQNYRKYWVDGNLKFDEKYFIVRFSRTILNNAIQKYT